MAIQIIMKVVINNGENKRMTKRSRLRFKPWPSIILRFQSKFLNLYFKTKNIL